MQSMKPWCFGNLNYSDCEACPWYDDCYHEAAMRDLEESKLNTVEIEAFCEKGEQETS